MWKARAMSFDETCQGHETGLLPCFDQSLAFGWALLRAFGLRFGSVRDPLGSTGHVCNAWWPGPWSWRVGTAALGDRSVVGEQHLGGPLGNCWLLGFDGHRSHHWRTICQDRSQIWFAWWTCAGAVNDSDWPLADENECSCRAGPGMVQDANWCKL